MKTFHGSQELKTMYVNRVKDAVEKKNLVRFTVGKPVENGWQGCFLGVMSHKDNTEFFSPDFCKEIGLPQMVLHLIPEIFDGTPGYELGNFSLRLVNAIPVGVDSSLIEEMLPFGIISRTPALQAGEMLISFLESFEQKSVEENSVEEVVIEESLVLT